MSAWSNLLIESKSPRCCFSTEDCNERRNDCANIIEEKIIPDWFLYPIVMIVKSIESLEITFVHINPFKKVIIVCYLRKCIH